MAEPALSQQDRKRIDHAVEHFKESRHLFENFAQGLMVCFQNSPELAQHIHFIKYRIKDVEHLRDKLARKRLEAKEDKRQEVTDESNLFQEVNDLAGIRIIHLHTDQLRYIHNAILGILDEQQYRLVENRPPTVGIGNTRTYSSDMESVRALGIQCTQPSITSFGQISERR